METRVKSVVPANGDGGKRDNGAERSGVHYVPSTPASSASRIYGTVKSFSSSPPTSLGTASKVCSRSSRDGFNASQILGKRTFMFITGGDDEDEGDPKRVCHTYFWKTKRALNGIGKRDSSLITGQDSGDDGNSKRSKLCHKDFGAHNHLNNSEPQKLIESGKSSSTRPSYILKLKLPATAIGKASMKAASRLTPAAEKPNSTNVPAAEGGVTSAHESLTHKKSSSASVKEFDPVSSEPEITSVPEVTLEADLSVKSVNGETLNHEETSKKSMESVDVVSDGPLNTSVEAHENAIKTRTDGATLLRGTAHDSPAAENSTATETRASTNIYEIMESTPEQRPTQETAIEPSSHTKNTAIPPERSQPGLQHPGNPVLSNENRHTEGKASSCMADLTYSHAPTGPPILSNAGTLATFDGHLASSSVDDLTQYSSPAMEESGVVCNTVQNTFGTSTVTFDNSNQTPNTTPVEQGQQGRDNSHLQAILAQLRQDNLNLKIAMQDRLQQESILEEKHAHIVQQRILETQTYANEQHTKKLEEIKITYEQEFQKQANVLQQQIAEKENTITNQADQLRQEREMWQREVQQQLAEREAYFAKREEQIRQHEDAMKSRMSVQQKMLEFSRSQEKLKLDAVREGIHKQQMELEVATQALALKQSQQSQHQHSDEPMELENTSAAQSSIRTSWLEVTNKPGSLFAASNASEQFGRNFGDAKHNERTAQPDTSRPTISPERTPSWPTYTPRSIANDDDDDDCKQKFREAKMDITDSDDNEESDTEEKKAAQDKISRKKKTRSVKEERPIAIKLWQDLGSKVIGELELKDLSEYNDLLRSKVANKVNWFVEAYVKTTKKHVKFLREEADKDVDNSGYQFEELLKPHSPQDEDIREITSKMFLKAVNEERGLGLKKSNDYVFDNWQSTAKGTNWGGRRNDEKGILETD